MIIRIKPKYFGYFLMLLVLGLAYYFFPCRTNKYCGRSSFIRESKNIKHLMTMLAIFIFISGCCFRQSKINKTNNPEFEEIKALFKIESFNDSLAAFVNRYDSIPEVECPILYHIYMKRVLMDTIVIFHANFGVLCDYVFLPDSLNRIWGQCDVIGTYEHDQKRIVVYKSCFDTVEDMVNVNFMTHNEEKYDLINNLGKREVVRISQRLPQNYTFPFVQYKVINGELIVMPSFMSDS